MPCCGSRSGSWRRSVCAASTATSLLLSIAGVADGDEPEEPVDGGSACRRLLDLHALHEISQRFVDQAGFQYACTGFLAGPGAAAGRTLLARNFDFEGG